MPDKIKVDTPLEPNCEVMVEESSGWETRWFNEENSLVYAFHRGYLWPQRHVSKYLNFRLLQPIPEGVLGVWQNFIDYEKLGKSK